MENILIKYLNESKDLYRLEKATKGSAGFDLLASINNSLEIGGWEISLVPCGFLFKCLIILKLKLDPVLV